MLGNCAINFHRYHFNKILVVFRCFEEIEKFYLFLGLSGIFTGPLGVFLGKYIDRFQERIQNFKLGGGNLKNRAERREARKFLGYFVWKIKILGKKIIFFPILGGPHAGCTPP